MRLLIGLVALVAALWTGYWGIASTAKDRAMSAWFEARRADGWVAEYEDVSVFGYPGRFDTTLSNLVLADPQSGVVWRAPRFQILALSYKPNHVIAVWPRHQTLASPEESVAIDSDKMRASLVFEPDTALALDRSTLEMSGLTLRGADGWESGVESAVLATRQTVGRANFYDIAFDATGVRPGGATRARLDPSGLLPETVEAVKLDLTVGFDAPWDRRAIERARPQITRLEVNALTAIWGRLELRAEGGLDVDAEGYPVGTLNVKARNWREMLHVAVAGGVLSGAVARTVEGGLSLLAGVSGAPETIEVTLSFAHGRVSLGPIPLGAAPRLRLR